MRVLAFAASSSKQSINQKLAAYVANLVEGATVELLDINDYEMPIFSEDREKQLEQPEQAKQFYAKITEADLLIISFAEHNGSYTAAYKNLFDWTSRIDQKVFQNKPTLLLSTSPGARGGASVLEQASNSTPRFGADVKASVAVPSFQQNFDLENSQILNSEIRHELLNAVSLLIS